MVCTKQKVRFTTTLVLDIQREAEGALRQSGCSRTSMKTSCSLEQEKRLRTHAWSRAVVPTVQRDLSLNKKGNILKSRLETLRQNPVRE
nr:unnamed protein product [Fasciola hepatica]